MCSVLEVDKALGKFHTKKLHWHTCVKTVPKLFLCSNDIFSQRVAIFDQWDLPGWNHSEHGKLYCEDREKGATTPSFYFFFPFHDASRLFLRLEIDFLKCLDVPTSKEHAVEAGYHDPNL